MSLFDICFRIIGFNALALVSSKSLEIHSVEFFFKLSSVLDFSNYIKYNHGLQTSKKLAG